MTVSAFEGRLRQFFDEIAVVQHYQRLSESVFKQTVKELIEKKNQLEQLDAETKEIFETNLSVYSIYNPYTGIIQPYSVNKTSIAERVNQLHLFKNRQYQWLLAEAYELFEDFILSIYDIAGNSDIKLRLAKDKANELDKKELKKKVHQIMNHFRLELPELKAIEHENKIQKNLRLYINIIEKFRHIVVHKNGRTENSELVIEQILKSSCLFSDNQRAPEARAIVGSYIGTGDIDGLLVLVEKPIFEVGGVSMHVNRHEDLVNVLLSYALVLSQCLVNRCCVAET